MGALVCGALLSGTRLILTAPRNIVTVYDFTRCYGGRPVVQPCERVLYRAGMLNVVFNAWVGVLLIVVAAWLLWDSGARSRPGPLRTIS